MQWAPFYFPFSWCVIHRHWPKKKKQYIRLDFALCMCQPLEWHVSSDKVVGQQGHRSMCPTCFTSTLVKRLLNLQLVSCCLFDVDHHVHQPLSERLLLRNILEDKNILQANSIFLNSKKLSNKLTSDLLFCFLFFLFVTFAAVGVLFCHLILDILRWWHISLIFEVCVGR